MNVETQSTEHQSVLITITISPDDYRDEYTEQLKKYRQKADFKGFRKGKAPMSFVKKMVGKSALYETVNKIIDKHLSGVIEDNGYRPITAPITTEDQKQFEFDPNGQEEFEFRFEIGLKPDLDLSAFGEGEKFTRYEPEIDDSFLQEEMDRIKKRFGTLEPTDDKVEEDDVIHFEGVELDGEKGKEIEKGHQTDFRLDVRRISEELKKKVLGKKAGTKLKADIFKLQDNVSDKYVRKYFLNLDDEEEQEIGPWFELNVKEVLRLKPAEFDEELSRQAFGEVLESEEAAKDRIKEIAGRNLQVQSEALLYQDMQEWLLTELPVELPEAFLRRYLDLQQEEKPSDEDFAKSLKGVKWQLIEQEIVNESKIQVSEQEVIQRLQSKVMQYFGGQMDQARLNDVVQYLLRDEKEYREAHADVLLDKVFIALEEKVEVDLKKLSKEEFEKIAEMAPGERLKL